jgi:peptidoglycan/LPS O-acetylase OafA/YrhL
MSMPRIAIVMGLLMVIQGVGFYFGTGMTSVTALIPTFVGAPILLLGLLALRESLRMHAMHFAAVLGLLGLLAALGRIGMAGLSVSAASTSLLLMVLLCAVFLALCIKSFRDARRRQRDAAES